jgi:sigma54-dependent transcription regulator
LINTTVTTLTKDVAPAENRATAAMMIATAARAAESTAEMTTAVVAAATMATAGRTEVATVETMSNLLTAATDEMTPTAAMKATTSNSPVVPTSVPQEVDALRGVTSTMRVS